MLYLEHVSKSSFDIDSVEENHIEWWWSKAIKKIDLNIHLTYTIIFMLYKYFTYHNSQVYSNHRDNGKNR